MNQTGLTAICEPEQLVEQAFPGEPACGDSPSYDASVDRGHLAFVLNGEECAIEMRYVIEVIGFGGIRELEGAPGYVKGFIDYRGRNVAVVDIRERAGMPVSAETDYSCVIVLSVNDFLMGVVVDRVSEIVEFDAEAIDRGNLAVEGAANGVISGVARICERMKVLLDARNFFSPADLAGLSPAA